MQTQVLVLVALAIVGARAQNGAAGENAAPEPYSYGYQTDTHSAAEQRDPNGRVTGFYNIGRYSLIRLPLIGSKRHDKLISGYPFTS